MVLLNTSTSIFFLFNFFLFIVISPSKHNHLIPKKFWALPQQSDADNNNLWVLADAIMGIVTIERLSYLILITSKIDVGSIYGHKIFQVDGTTFVSFRNDDVQLSSRVKVHFFNSFLILF